MEQGDILHP